MQIPWSKTGKKKKDWGWLAMAPNKNDKVRKQDE